MTNKIIKYVTNFCCYFQLDYRLTKNLFINNVLLQKHDLYLACPAQKKDDTDIREENIHTVATDILLHVLLIKIIITACYYHVIIMLLT